MRCDPSEQDFRDLLFAIGKGQGGDLIRFPSQHFHEKIVKMIYD